MSIPSESINTENSENQKECKSADLLETEVELESSKVKTSENQCEEKDLQEDDPYAYINRGDFTSEIFKIEIRGLPKFYGIGELKSLLRNKLNLNISKIKAPKVKKPWVYVCFRSEEDKIKAINLLNGFRWKGKTLSTKEAKPTPDPLVQKRKKFENLTPEAKRCKLEETAEERLKKSTIPLWDMTYSEQLSIKEEDAREILKELAKNLLISNPELKPLLTERQKQYDGLPCELLNIRYGEKIEGYRNKCEFTVGKNVDGSPTVGFRFGSYTTGVTSVGPVDDLRHIPDKMKLAVKLFETFVRNSNLEIFDPELQTGNFRQLTARYASSSNQLMLVVCIHPQQLTEDEISNFKKEVTSFFTEGKGKEAQVTSLYYQALIKRNAGEQPRPAEHLHGDLYIYETILGLKFRISPESFFQVNTETAEILYSAAIELANPTSESTVVDICCGTGTIGLCFAKKCKQVLGLEIISQAITNAKENAVDNGITNADFFTGAAEEILSTVMQRVATEDIIAIVDPPRAGLHQKAIEMLRRANKLKKLVYIACNPRTAAKNFVSLGRPASKTMSGAPFVPMKAVAVDMFPYTKHFELLIYFERVNQENN